MDWTTILLTCLFILLIAGIVDAVFGFRVFWIILETLADMLFWLSIFSDD